MARQIEADGHRWEVSVEDRSAHEGRRAVVFYCVTDPQRGYRVVEVSESRLVDDELEEDDGSLERLYAESQPFDYTPDPKARESTIGHEPRPRSERD